MPLPEAKTNHEQLSALGYWLNSYNPKDLFTESGEPTEEILSIVPKSNAKKLGQRAEANGGYIPLDVP